MKPDPVVSLREVGRTFRQGSQRIEALRDITLELLPGEMTALVGPSGSGKTTLLNLLVGWELPDVGAIEWAEDGPSVKLDWGFLALVPQRLGLLEDLSAEENIELPMVLNGWTKFSVTSRSRALMDELSILHLRGRLPSESSLGEQQRVAIARALSLKPSVVVADEPTGNQDRSHSLEIMNQFRSVAREGASCLIATHDPTVSSQCDRIVALRSGSIVNDPPGVRR